MKTSQISETTNPPVVALSIKQTCAVTNLTPPTIYAEINAGRLRSFKVGRRRLVGLEALREWQRNRLAEQTGEAEAASEDRG